MKRAWDTGPVPYVVTCAVALIAVYLVQTRHGIHFVDYLVLLVGLLGIVSRWSLAPLMLLVAMGGAYAAKAVLGLRMEVAAPPTLRGEHVILCLAVLAYCGAQFRLQGLTFHAFPFDPRYEPRGDNGAPRPQARATRLADRAEVGRFLLSLPAWVLVGQVAWIFVGASWSLLDWPPRVSRILLIAWALAGGLGLCASLLRLWRRYQQSVAEAAVFLQDALWRETRGDQRRLNRWLAWARLKQRNR
jgi:hypothetical protein